jgi:hypothetical protein
MLAAAWVTAVCTAVLAAGAIVTAIFAVRAFSKQSQEVRDQAGLLSIQSDQLQAQKDQLREQQAQNARQTEVLDLQSRELRESIEERRRTAEDGRRSRVAFVYMTAAFDRGLHPGPGAIALAREPGVDVVVYNTGRQPVYDARVHWVDSAKGSQAGESDSLGTLQPGSAVSARRDLPAGTAQSDFIPVAYFRDAAGLRWTLLADGQLDEVDQAWPPGAPMIATTAVAKSRSPRGRPGDGGAAQ